MRWRTDELPKHKPLLPYGAGRSYGDACLNNGGTIIPTQHLNHFISFDKTQGILRCEAGVTLADVLKLIVPAGWFLEVTPGTKFITIGGAIANDVHGKNHYRAGTFGCHVTQFELLRSDGERLMCGPASNPTLFRTTIGGLGLTGLITWAEFKLKRLASTHLDVESIRTQNIEETVELLNTSRTTHEYSIASLDSAATGQGIGRGHVLRGNHGTQASSDTTDYGREPRLTVPINIPLLNTPLITLFNKLYYNRQLAHHVTSRMHYEPFFYPQDAIGYWNRLYGSRGFLQHQCQLPPENIAAVARELLQTVTAAGFASPITTLKPLGEAKSPGMLSFPRPGFTLALDFPNAGPKLYELFTKLTAIVRAAGGSMYLAKDARMSAEDFQAFYPSWGEFATHIDPQFSSSLWRRVTKQLH